MNYFEQELRRITKVCNGITNPTFAGRACYADLGGDNRVKLEFVICGTHEKYEALKATILNRTEGEVDSLLFRFKDTWGNKNHPSFSKGVKPHIWNCDGKNEWYAYRPTDADMKQLAAEVGAYLAVFADRSLVPEKESVMKAIRSAKGSPAPRKGDNGRKKTEPEL
jgi:hypothetical protein